MASSAKLAVERETTERRAATDDILRRLQELLVGFDQEKVDREMADTAVRGQLTNLREQLTSEREERLNEGVHVKRTIQRVAGQLTEQATDYKTQMDAESGRRVAGDERIERQCVEIRSSVMQEEASRIEAFRECERAIRAMRVLLEHSAHQSSTTHTTVLLDNGSESGSRIVNEVSRRATSEYSSSTRGTEFSSSTRGFAIAEEKGA